MAHHIHNHTNTVHAGHTHTQGEDDDDDFEDPMFDGLNMLEEIEKGNVFASRRSVDRVTVGIWMYVVPPPPAPPR